jgi:hypothetical protein
VAATACDTGHSKGTAQLTNQPMLLNPTWYPSLPQTHTYTHTPCGPPLELLRAPVDHAWQHTCAARNSQQQQQGKAGQER